MIAGMFHVSGYPRFVSVYAYCRRCGASNIYDHGLCNKHHMPWGVVPAGAKFHEHSSSIRYILSRYPLSVAKHFLPTFSDEELKDFAEKAQKYYDEASPGFTLPTLEGNTSEKALEKWNYPQGFAEPGLMESTVVIRVKGTRLRVEEDPKEEKDDSLMSILFGR